MSEMNYLEKNKHYLESRKVLNNLEKIMCKLQCKSGLVLDGQEICIFLKTEGVSPVSFLKD